MSEELGHGITCIDARYMRAGMACFYLLQQGDELAIIETGTSHSVESLLELMRARGLNPEQVRYVIPTHVHLDHAGGAGRMMQVFPRASLVVHPRGARHMIEPAKLIAGSIAVYGEEQFRVLYGDVVSGGWFSGDVFGISYPELRFPCGDYLLPTTTPVQLAPDKLLSSIQLLLDAGPEHCYLTHFGKYSDIERGAAQLCRQVEAYREIALACADREDRVAAIRDELWRYTRQQLADWGAPAVADDYEGLLAVDMDLNSQGLDVWLARTAAQ
jgi:glyoxylase-like metal-dependent hydrolase (beta-lactamase superfamily II)